MRAATLALTAILVCIAAPLLAQQTAVARVIPEADELFVLLLVDEDLLDADEPLDCSWELSIGRQTATYSERFDAAWDAYDLGGVCVVRASQAFTDLTWPDSGTLTATSTLTIGGRTIDVEPVEVRIRERELSSTRGIVEALEAIGAQVTIGDASSSFGLFYDRDAWAVLGEREIGLHITTGLVRYLPEDLCLCTQEECTVCGTSHAVTVYASESAERLLVIDALRSVLE